MIFRLTRLYSSKKEEKPAYINDDDKLSKYKTKKGIIGSALPGLPGIMAPESLKDLYTNNLIGLGIVASGPIGRHAGNKKAEELDRKGKKDKEILRRSVLHGTSVGALTGATFGAGLGHARGEMGKMAAIGGALGAIGAGVGTGISVKDRLDRRKKYADRS